MPPHIVQNVTEQLLIIHEYGGYAGPGQNVVNGAEVRRLAPRPVLHA